MMKYRSLLLLVLCLVLSFAACSDKSEERAKAREELDEEFEKETGELVLVSKKLHQELLILIKEHQALDLRHKELDKKLANVKLSKEDSQAQQTHDKWEKSHKALIEEVQNTLMSFNTAVEKHEEMEKHHENAAIEQLKDDHEEFEKELQAYKQTFSNLQSKMKEAKKQMQIIFEQHDKIDGKY